MFRPVSYFSLVFVFNLRLTFGGSVRDSESVFLSDEKYPYVLGVHVKEYIIDRTFEMNCSGLLLVKPHCVLTSARCVVTGMKTIVHKSSVTIFHDTNNYNYPQKKTTAEKIFVHPLYWETYKDNKAILPYDISVIVSVERLEGKLEPMKYSFAEVWKKRIELARKEEEDCDWIGYYVNKGAAPKKNSIRVQLLNDRSCMEALEGTGLKGASLWNKICAKTLAPFTCDNKYGGTALDCDMVVGIHSNTFKCDEPKKPQIMLFEDIKPLTYLMGEIGEASCHYGGFGGSGSPGGQGEQGGQGAVGGAPDSSEVATESDASYIYSHTGIIYIILYSSWGSGMEAAVDFWMT